MNDNSDKDHSQQQSEQQQTQQQSDEYASLQFGDDVDEDLQKRLTDLDAYFRESMEKADSLSEEFLQNIQSLLENYHAYYSKKRIERLSEYESLIENILVEHANNRSIEQSIEYIKNLSSSMYMNIQNADKTPKTIQKVQQNEE